MLPMSVDTMESEGRARSRARSASRGCRYLEPAATSREYGSRSWVQAPSSSSQARFSARGARESARLEARNQFGGGGARVGVQTHRDRLDQAEHARVGIDLDD